MPAARLWAPHLAPTTHLPAPRECQPPSGLGTGTRRHGVPHCCPWCGHRPCPGPLGLPHELCPTSFHPGHWARAPGGALCDVKQSSLTGVLSPPLGSPASSFPEELWPQPPFSVRAPRSPDSVEGSVCFPNGRPRSRPAHPQPPSPGSPMPRATPHESASPPGRDLGKPAPRHSPSSGGSQGRLPEAPHLVAGTPTLTSCPVDRQRLPRFLAALLPRALPSVRPSAHPSRLPLLAFSVLTLPVTLPVRPTRGDTPMIPLLSPLQEGIQCSCPSRRWGRSPRLREQLWGTQPPRAPSREPSQLPDTQLQ